MEHFRLEDPCNVNMDYLIEQVFFLPFYAAYIKYGVLLCLQSEETT